MHTHQYYPVILNDNNKPEKVKGLTSIYQRNQYEKLAT